jgi:choline dehydrogenase-like flavoprotein
MGSRASRFKMAQLTNHLKQQLSGRVISYAQGKALGGSSTRNQMIYQRGSRGSYDRWAAEVGDADYKWDNMREHFDRSVHIYPYNNSLRATNASVASYDISKTLQSGGPLKASWPNFAMPFSSWGLKGLFAGGLPRLHGFFSDGNLHGAAYNVSNGTSMISQYFILAYQYSCSHSPSIQSFKPALLRRTVFSSKR